MTHRSHSWSHLSLEILKLQQSSRSPKTIKVIRHRPLTVKLQRPVFLQLAIKKGTLRQKYCQILKRFWMLNSSISSNHLFYVSFISTLPLLKEHYKTNCHSTNCVSVALLIINRTNTCPQLSQFVYDTFFPVTRISESHIFNSMRRFSKLL